MPDVSKNNEMVGYDVDGRGKSRILGNERPTPAKQATRTRGNLATATSKFVYKTLANMENSDSKVHSWYQEQQEKKVDNGKQR